MTLQPDRSDYLTHPLTVTITLRCWSDGPDQEPIEETVENALRPILGPDETMLIDVHDRREPR